MKAEPAKVLSIVRFGDDMEVDLRSCELRRAGRVVKIERRPMDLLLLLLQNPDRLVSREEIVEQLWGKGVFLDTENGINTAVRKLRAALKDDPERPRFLQTIPARGYRFVASVDRPAEPAALPEPPQLAGSVPDAPDLTPHTPAHPARRRVVLLAITAAALVTAIFASVRLLRARPVAEAGNGRIMLAVLPFDNLTGDPSQEYFSDGLTEEMITQLGRLDPPHLGIIARTSVMTYKGSRAQVTRIGQELGVQYVLEGSVRRAADRVRITAQLIEVKTQSRVWAREYDRDLHNLLNLQAEIAQEVADEMPQASAAGTTPSSTQGSGLSSPSYVAYDLYLKGRYYWNKRTAEGFKQAIDCFEQSVRLDQNFPRAYAGLADTYALLASYDFAAPAEVMPKARDAALRGLQLDDRLAEAHGSLALITENYDWDWTTAEREFRRAIDLNPSYATAHQWYAEFLGRQGRFDEALAESERARQLDPLSLIIAADDAVLLNLSRRYDRAIDRFRFVLGVEPGFPRANMIVDAYIQKREFQEALAQIELWHRSIDEGPWAWAKEAYVYGTLGKSEQARHAVHELKNSAQRLHMDPTPMLAVAYVGVGDKNEALACLETLLNKRSAVVTSLKVDPVYDPLRSDPRFQLLLGRAGLSP